MQKEIAYIQFLLGQALTGESWFGRSASVVLGEVNRLRVYEKPGGNCHSLIELLYHMVSWAELTNQWLGEGPFPDSGMTDKMDWITIDPAIHRWDQGVISFNKAHEKLIALLENRDDSFLDQMVAGQNYPFRYLLHGLMQHSIYHLGQIAYLNRLLG